MIICSSRVNLLCNAQSSLDFSADLGQMSHPINPSCSECATSSGKTLCTFVALNIWEFKVYGTRNSANKRIQLFTLEHVVFHCHQEVYKTENPSMLTISAKYIFWSISQV
jgi:hypothetical protein